MGLEKIIVALDVDTREEALNIVKKLGKRIEFYKIGSVLFTKYGADFVKELKNLGKKVFLDLKYHDIPNTVSNAIKNAIDLKVDMITLHTIGGFEMMREAVLTVDKNGKAGNKPILLGVTVLTSMKTKDLREIGLNRTVESQVKKLAKLATFAGLKGFVCSAKEIKLVRKITGKNGIIVVPGIRLDGDEAGDQKRVATPTEAIKNGASYLVMGRTILSAKNIDETLDKIEAEIS